MDYEPFLRQLEASNWSPETIKAYTSDLKLFSSFLKNRGLRVTQVTPSVIAAFVEHMRQQSNPRFERTGLSETTITRRMAAISGLFEFLRATSNPRLKNPTQVVMRRNRRRTTKRHQGKAVDDVTLDLLMNGITDPRDRAIVSLFASSGLRLSELHQLDVSTLQEITEEREGGPTRIWGTGRVLGKGGKERVFYFDEPTVAAIHEYLNTRTDNHPALWLSERNQRLSKRAIQDLVATWCRKLSLSRVHVHALRHTFATRLASANIEAMVLKDLMGHARFETTTRYFTLTEETRARQYFSALEYLKAPNAT